MAAKHIRDTIITLHRRPSYDPEQEYYITRATAGGIIIRDNIWLSCSTFFIHAKLPAPSYSIVFRWHYSIPQFGPTFARFAIDWIFTKPGLEKLWPTLKHALRVTGMGLSIGSALTARFWNSRSNVADVTGVAGLWSWRRPRQLF